MTLARTRRPTCEARSAARKASPMTYTPPWKYRTTWRGSIPAIVISAVGTPPSAPAVTVRSADSGWADSAARSSCRCSCAVLPTGKADRRRIPSTMACCSLLTRRPHEYPAAVVPVPRRHSWMHLQADPAVESHRLHQPERDLRGEHVRGREHAGVLFDDRRGRRLAHRAQVGLHGAPHVPDRAVLLEVGRRIDGGEGSLRAGLEVRHVLLVERDVVARAEPAEVAADERLPGVGQRRGRHAEVARDVVGQIDDKYGHPAHVYDVDHHQGVVLG